MDKRALRMEDMYVATGFEIKSVDHAFESMFSSIAFLSMCVNEAQSSARGSCMLSTVFDASSCCRTDGVLIECTLQLQQLPGGTGAIVGSDFVCLLHRIDDAVANKLELAFVGDFGIVTARHPLPDRPRSCGSPSFFLTVAPWAHLTFADGCVISSIQ